MKQFTNFKPISGTAALIAMSAALPLSLAAFAQTSPSTSAPVTDAALALVGKAAPTFTLPDQADKTHALADSHGKWTVVAFYPKDMSGGCTFQNKSYSTVLDKFAPLNAVVYTISTQDTASKKQFCSLDNLHHTLLSDVGGATAKAYGVLNEKSQMARRVTFYVSPEGTIADVDTKIHVQTAGEDSIARLTNLEKPKTAAIGGGASTGSRALASAKAAVATATVGQFTGPASVKVKLDQPMPDFMLSNPANGKNEAFSTITAGKKATVFIFVSTQCPVSNAYNDRMEQIASTYTSKGVEVAGINANMTESNDAIVAHAKQHGFTFPVLKDAEDKVANQFAAKVTPEVYLVDAKGVLVYHGPIDDSQDPSGVTHHYLADALDSVLAGSPVRVKSARAFGCSIKRNAAQ